MARDAEKQIYEALKREDRTLSPVELHGITGLNHSTVRRCLASMFKKGKVARPAYGLYSITPALGVGENLKPPLIQNLVFTASAVVDKSARWVVDLDERSRLIFTAGKKRNKITVTVKAPHGLGVHGFYAVLRLIDCELAKHGYGELEFMVKNYEFLYDYMGQKLEGLNAVTLNNFKGYVEKLYNKTYGVRREIRSFKPTSIESIIPLLQGGMSYNQVIQGVGVVHNDISNLTHVMKESLYTRNKEIDLINVLMQSHFKLIDTVADLTANIKELITK